VALVSFTFAGIIATITGVAPRVTAQSGAAERDGSAVLSDVVDGAYPAGVLIEATDGNLYGITTEGGTENFGTIYRLTRDGHVAVLHSFDSNPGVMVAGRGVSLIQAKDGNFYGTTSLGGASNRGTIFRMLPDGTFMTIYSFSGNLDGGGPAGASLIEGRDGNLYGTAASGGTFGEGTVFQATRDGVITVLYAFAGDPDGAAPGTLIHSADGNFYGVTAAGGFGDGTVFKMTLDGIVTTLHRFNRAVGDAINPVTLIQTRDGSLYGTADSRFDRHGRRHGGTVFRIAPDGTETVVPQGSFFLDHPTLIEASDGNLYGTTFFGGLAGSLCGGVFKLTPTGQYSRFRGLPQNEAKEPVVLMQASDGQFYGAAFQGPASTTGECQGGRYDRGNVFRIAPDSRLSVVYRFTGGELPDLVVERLSVPKMSGAGEVMTVDDSTRNRNLGLAGASVTRFYLSHDAVLDGGDVLLGERHVSVLDGKSGQAGSTSVTIPAGTVTGDYYVIAVADGPKHNTRAAKTIIGPNLSVSAISAPLTAFRGDTIAVSDVTTNAGGGSTRIGSVTGLYLVKVHGTSSPIRLGERTVSVLAAGSSDSGTTRLTLPSDLPPAFYYVIGNANDTATVTETNTTDNERRTTIEIVSRK
jgi:uncharacterized repeat protein (TIGR03803 family)